MIHPFLHMTIYGAIWYQGEANQGEPDNYVCAMSRMVIDWRAKWFAAEGETDTDFSFGQVQVSKIFHVHFIEERDIITREQRKAQHMSLGFGKTTMSFIYMI